MMIYPKYRPPKERLVEFLQNVFVYGLIGTAAFTVMVYLFGSAIDKEQAIALSEATVWAMITLLTVLAIAFILRTIHSSKQARKAELLRRERQVALRHYPDEPEILALKLQRNVYQLLLDLAYENGDTDEEKNSLQDSIEVLGEEIERLAANMKTMDLLEIRAREKEKTKAIIFPFGGYR
jgi:type VI protein secretion system component VasK